MEFIANTAYNKTKVLQLLTSTPGERITTATHVFNGELRQIVGEEMGQLAGFGYLRNDQGQQVFGNDGIPLASAALRTMAARCPSGSVALPIPLNTKASHYLYLSITS